MPLGGSVAREQVFSVGNFMNKIQPLFSLNSNFSRFSSVGCNFHHTWIIKLHPAEGSQILRPSEGQNRKKTEYLFEGRIVW